MKIEVFEKTKSFTFYPKKSDSFNALILLKDENS